MPACRHMATVPNALAPEPDGLSTQRWLRYGNSPDAYYTLTSFFKSSMLEQLEPLAVMGFPEEHRAEFHSANHEEKTQNRHTQAATAMWALKSGGNQARTSI